MSNFKENSINLGEKSVKEIQRTVTEANVQLLLLDLNSLDSVRKFAANLHSTVDKVWNYSTLICTHLCSESFVRTKVQFPEEPHCTFELGECSLQNKQ
jgi:hypothetical protein